MISFPNAKINIGLNVVEKRLDGYHNLETIFYPVKLADALEFVEANNTALTISGIQVDGDPENNLIIKAYRLLRRDFQLPELHFHLHKVVPFGAGLGGGSSDAAFALKMLNKHFNLNLDDQTLEQYATGLGADCPFFIRNKPTFAYGIGDQFESIELDLSEYSIVIIKPDCSVSTVEAYRTITPQKPDFDLRRIASLPVEEWRRVIKNDFETSVFPQYPQIRELKHQLYDLGAVYAAMSGSGSAVFGIFRHLPTDLANSLPKGIFIYR
ncbi:4-(cytidine 5'-diphospho)-2-C-methyl-D-erythritol kinase [Maribellus sediminis]|uniref:4-(cytidine 5'-diphospho)-2-C-methyl-D-erythritol kinase n=1 Tax=Maribellus sediminis TaxID=2696285 RepID=UPI00142F8B5D|nr:4-(cytidine 5'-diphospho)-2-C-methyl-D-erythritol kinase [Maribellus sediminis]